MNLETSLKLAKASTHEERREICPEWCGTVGMEDVARVLAEELRENFWEMLGAGGTHRTVAKPRFIGSRWCTNGRSEAKYAAEMLVALGELEADPKNDPGSRMGYYNWSRKPD